MNVNKSPNPTSQAPVIPSKNRLEEPVDVDNFVDKLERFYHKRLKYN